MSNLYVIYFEGIPNWINFVAGWLFVIASIVNGIFALWIIKTIIQFKLSNNQ